jgi:tetratricopeptide (TPR) repeat protein
VDKANARRLYDLRRYRESIEYYTKHLAHDPYDGDSFAMVALCHLHLDETLEANKCARRAVDISPNSAYVHYVQGIVCAHSGTTEGAKACLYRALNIDPDAAYIHSAMAVVYLQEGTWRAAVHWADKALALDPDDSEAKSTRAHALAAMGRAGKASIEGRQALSEHPEDANAFATNGHISLHLGNHKQAVEFFEAAVRLEPQNEFAKEGLREALRWSFPPYRLNRFVALRLDALNPAASLAATMVAVFACGMTYSMSEAVHWLRPVAIAGFVVLAFSVLMGLVGPPIIDSVSLLNPERRRLFTPQQRAQNLLSLAIFLAALGGVATIIAGHMNAGFMSVLCALAWLYMIAIARRQGLEGTNLKLVFWILGPLALMASIALIVFPDWLDEDPMEPQLEKRLQNDG